MLTFSTIPANIRTPGAYVEVDNSRAFKGLQLNTKMLVIGQRRSVGTVAALTLTQVNSAEQAKNYFGQGSNLANMIKVIKENNKFVELWAIALDDNGAGVQAAGSIAVTGPATEAGTLNLYIAGQKLAVAVANGDSANTVAGAINTAINAKADLPVTSTVSTNTVTVTARHKGLVGNEVDMRFNYYGLAGGEKTPTGLSFVVTQLTGGTTNPTLSTALDALPEDVFNFVICPYTDSTSLTALEAEFAGRWSGLQMLEGHTFIAKDDTQGNLTTFGNGRNSQFVSCLGVDDSPSPAYEWASALGAQVAFAASNDPARPFTNLPLKGVLAPIPDKVFTQEERNTLLYDGISTYRVAQDNTVVIDRVITMYQSNQVFAADPSYLDATTMFTLSVIRQRVRNLLQTKFANFKIRSDSAGFRPNPGQKITTPNAIKAELVGLFSELETLGLIENIAQFKNEIVVERNANDPTRVDVQLPPDLVNPLHIIAAQIQFLL